MSGSLKISVKDLIQQLSHQADAAFAAGDLQNGAAIIEDIYAKLDKIVQIIPEYNDNSRYENA